MVLYLSVCAYIYICNQIYSLTEWFNMPADQRMLSPVHSLSPSPRMLCAVRSGWEANSTLFGAWLPRAVEEQECITAAQKIAAGIRDRCLTQLFFLTAASLLIFLS